MLLLLTLCARIRLDRTTASAKMDLYRTVVIVKVQHSFYDEQFFFLFSVVEQTEFDKPCNLIGSGSGRNFPIQLLTAGGIVVLIYFRKQISPNRQSFAFFTLPSTINQRKFISIHF